MHGSSRRVWAPQPSNTPAAVVDTATTGCCMAELSAEHLVIEHEDEAGAVVLALRGELDLAAVPLLQRQLVMAGSGAPSV